MIRLSGSFPISQYASEKMEEEEGDKACFMRCMNAKIHCNCIEFPIIILHQGGFSNFVSNITERCFCFSPERENYSKQMIKEGGILPENNPKAQKPPISFKG